MANPVLLVEDDAVFGVMLEIVLKRRGFAVRRVTDGRVMQRLIQTEAPPAAVLLDLSLPFIDGYHLLQTIRADKKWAAVPVLVISGHTKAKDSARALAAGATDYFVKPIELDGMLARLCQLLPAATA